MPSVLTSCSGRQPLSLFKLAAALRGCAGLVGVRTIKYIQGMNRKFDKSNKCDPTLYQGTFIFQTDGGRCREVPREATGEIWPIGRGEGGWWSRIHHTKPCIILVPPLLWETWLNVPLQEHNSVKATVHCYSFIRITSGMRQRMKQNRCRWVNAVCAQTEINTQTGRTSHCIQNMCHCWTIRLTRVLISPWPVVGLWRGVEL